MTKKIFTARRRAVKLVSHLALLAALVSAAIAIGSIGRSADPAAFPAGVGRLMPAAFVIAAVLYGLSALAAYRYWRGAWATSVVLYTFGLGSFATVEHLLGVLHTGISMMGLAVILLPSTRAAMRR